MFSVSARHVLQLKQRTDGKLLPLENTEVYNIICDSLAIEPKANNGTLRLPLKPIGLHSEYEDEDLEKLEENKASPKTVSSVLDEVQTLASLPASAFAAPASVVTATSVTEGTEKINSTAPPGASQNQNQTKASDQNSSSTTSFWDYLSEKVEAIKAWANAKISAITNHDASAPTDE